MCIVASANTEDYTNRGRIITPIRDRYGSQIRTHYPKTLEDEIEIMEREKTTFDDSHQAIIPQFMREIVAEITRQARESTDISQRSGVSVLVSISNYENILSNAIRRGIRLDEKEVAPRIYNLPLLVASIKGKIELESGEEDMDTELYEDEGAREEPSLVRGIP